MKITRRNFLIGAGVTLGKLAADWVKRLMPKAEAQEPLVTGVGHKSVLIPENWKDASSFEIIIEATDNASARLEDFALACRRNADELSAKWCELSQKSRRSFVSGDEPIQCRTFAAKDDMHLVGKVYLNCEDVTDRCFEFFGTAQPGVICSWIGLYEMDGDGHLLFDNKHYRHGFVRWERDKTIYTKCGRCENEIPAETAETCWYCTESLCYACWDMFGHCGHPEADAQNERSRIFDDFIEAVKRNGEFARSQIEQFYAWDFEWAMREYALEVKCTPSELTPAQKRQAWLNYVLEHSA